MVDEDPARGILADLLTQMYPPHLSGRVTTALNLVVFSAVPWLQSGVGWIIDQFEPAAGRVYALWLETESGERLLVGSFEPGADGSAILWAKLSSETGRAKGAAVTLEPADVAVLPTGAVQLRSL